eukprot:EG_transcript_34831
MVIPVSLAAVFITLVLVIAGFVRHVRLGGAACVQQPFSNVSSGVPEPKSPAHHLPAPSASQHLCPTTKGGYIYGNELLELEPGKTVCVDAVLYGYDLLFEQKRMFALPTWLGVPQQQDPSDALVIAELIMQERPDVIIELGTNEGGGALFYASIMELVGHGIVVTVDPRHYSTGWTPN